MKINYKKYAINKFKKELHDACQNYLLHTVRDCGKDYRIHFEIANILYEFITGNVEKEIIVNSEYLHRKEIMKIHNESQKITSYLNEKIGYDLKNESNNNYDILSHKLVNKLLELFSLTKHVKKFGKGER